MSIRTFRETLNYDAELPRTWRDSGARYDEEPTRAPRGDAEPQPAIVILGTRGIPACHGGFETFAERLALYLVGQGWHVTVACQSSDARPDDVWKGVHRRFHVSFGRGALCSVLFDARSVARAAIKAVRAGPNRPLILTLGYNTAIFGALFRVLGIGNVVNMDGVEWKRAKWSRPVKAWFWLNERIGALLADHMIADHPAIADHLCRHANRAKISVIPYGADAVTDAPVAQIAELGLTPGDYALVVARPEPENSLLEIVSAHAARPRACRLVVLGDYTPSRNDYHAAVLRAAGPNALFPGAIYDADLLASLRFHARLYVHGHRVGGTNPSLVEALGAGLPILAHDNVYNRWVAGPEMSYFSDIESCAQEMDYLLGALPSDNVLPIQRAAAQARFNSSFRWPMVLDAYQSLLGERTTIKSSRRLHGASKRGVGTDRLPGR